MAYLVSSALVQRARTGRGDQVGPADATPSGSGRADFEDCLSALYMAAKDFHDFAEEFEGSLRKKAA